MYFGINEMNGLFWEIAKKGSKTPGAGRPRGDDERVATSRSRAHAGRGRAASGGKGPGRAVHTYTYGRSSLFQKEILVTTSRHRWRDDSNQLLAAATPRLNERKARSTRQLVAALHASISCFKLSRVVPLHFKLVLLYMCK